MKSSCGESPSFTPSIKSGSSPERSTDGESSAMFSPVKCEKFMASTFCPVELASPVSDSIPFVKSMKIENPLHLFVRDEKDDVSENQEDANDDAATEKEDEPPQKKSRLEDDSCSSSSGPPSSPVKYSFVENNFETIYTAQIAYSLLFNTSDIPLDFVIPKDSVFFDPASWGLPLGKLMHSIKHDSKYEEQRGILILMGIKFANEEDIAGESSSSNGKAGGTKQKKTSPNLTRRYENSGFEVIYTAFLAFQQVYGHLNVTQRFVVPHNDERFPECTWGIKLGNRLDNIRRGHSHMQHRDRLRSLGVKC